MTKKLELRAGEVFSSLTVVREGVPSGSRGRITCVCGKEKVVLSENLRRGTATSCGCLRKPSRLSHGYTGTPTYSTWRSMLRRCSEPSHKDYAKYSKLGMTPSWQNFERFLSDMGERPSLRHTLDRRDNSKGYFAENCRWASWEEQQRNRTSNRHVVYTAADGNSRKVTLAEVCEILSLSRTTVQQRLSKHLIPIKRALGPAFMWPDNVNPYTGAIDE